MLKPLLAAALVAVVVPATAAGLLERKVRGGLEPALGRALGVPVTVGMVDTSLTGAVRLERVAVEGMLEVGAIEASVGLGSLLAGRIRADEIRIERPRLTVALDRAGRDRLAGVLRRAEERLRRAPDARPAGHRDGDERRLRRIVVRGGDLVVDLGDGGELRVSGVELHPLRSGVRVVAGPARLDLALQRWRLTGRFERTAADLLLPDIEFRRLLAVSGQLELSADGGPVLALDDAVLARGVTASNGVELSGKLGAGGPTLVARARPVSGGALVSVRADRLPLHALEPAVPAWLKTDGAIATGRAEVLAAAGRVAFDLDIDIERVAVDHPAVSRRPLELAGRLEARARVRRAPDGRLGIALERSRFRSGALELAAEGRAVFAPDRPLPEIVEVASRVPRTSCIGAVLALPEPLRDRLAGFDARGTIEASASLSFDRAAPERTALALDVDVGDCEVLLEPAHADPRRLLAPFEHRTPTGRRVVVGQGQRRHVSLSELPDHVALAFVAGEDGRFYRHHGFDPVQIERSLAVDLTEARIIRGGSTITQQLAKNLYLDPDRTVARKFQEAALAWRLERHLSKREILEVYLNIIELGEDVFGLSEAAHHWFGVEPARLSAREAAFLAAITPAPRSVSRRIRDHGGLDDATSARVDLLLAQMRRARVLDARTYARARKERLRLRPEVAAALP